MLHCLSDGHHCFLKSCGLLARGVLLCNLIQLILMVIYLFLFLFYLQTIKWVEIYLHLRSDASLIYVQPSNLLATSLFISCIVIHVI